MTNELGAEAGPLLPVAEDTGAEDIRLMLELRGGRDTALNELMLRWRAPLIAFFQRSTGSAEDAADLAQETFVRVYQSRASYRPGGKFSTWLFTIAANLARNLARWRSRHPTVELEDQSAAGTPGDAISPGALPDDTLEARERAKSVRKAITALPEDLREAMILFTWHDLSYRDISRIQKTNEKTVENRLYRARQILKERLRDLLE